jgi:putative ATP-dependent endonuclease of the OLD family
MVGFLPAIKSVRFEIAEEQRIRALRRSAKIIVDDGTPTDLERKGDGVQSLAALALMQHASEIGAKGEKLRNCN